MKQKDFNLQFVKAISSGATDFTDELISQIKDGAKLSAAGALEVYREDYEARLTESLRNTYRAIQSLIGDEDFNILSKDYIRSFTSTSPDLDDYGNQLSDFIKTHSLISDYIFLSELAHFEWNFREIFHLEQSLGLTAQDLLGVLLQSENELLQMAASARVLQYNFLITSLYAMKDSDTEVEPFDFEMPQFILMYKNGVSVKTQVLSQAQADIARNIMDLSSLKASFQNTSADTDPQEIHKLFQILGMERLILKSK